MPITDDELASELQRKLDLWLWNGVLWECVHWLVGVIGIASATATDEGTRIFPVIATACMGVLGFANPQKRSQRYLQPTVSSTRPCANTARCSSAAPHCWPSTAAPRNC